MSFKVLPITSSNKPQTLDGIKAFNRDLLVLWHNKNALFCKMNSHLEDDLRVFGILNLPCGIRDVILVQESIICLVENGHVYIVDISEDMLRKCEHVLKYREFNFTKDVAHISTTTDGFVALRKSGELIVFKLLYPEPGKSNISHHVTIIIPLNGSSGITHNHSYLTVLRTCNFLPKLASMLFRETALLDCDILFIALEDGNLYWLPILISSSDNDFNLMYSSTTLVKGIICFTDDEIKKYNKIMILSSNGSIAVMRCGTMDTQLKCDVVYFPGLIKSFCLVQQNNTFHADGLNLWYSDLVFPEMEEIKIVTRLMPIKGVIALTAVTDREYVLAGSRHGILYKIDCSSASKSGLGGSEKYDKRYETVEQKSQSILVELQHTAHELSSLREVLAAENKALHEISIAARGGLLKDMLKIKVEADDDFPHANKNTFKVKVSNKSLQEFSKDFWLFHVSIKIGEQSINFVEKLKSPFKPNSTLVFVIPVENSRFTLPITLDCSIVLVIPVGNLNDNNCTESKFLEIPLQRNLLGITYFLSPVLEESLINIHEPQVNIEESWKKLLKRFRSSQDHEPNSLGSHHLHCYSFKLPESTSWGTFVEEMVRNSQHQFHTSFKDVQVIKFRIRHSIVIFTYHSENHNVDAVTSNKDILNSMKDFIIQTFLLVKELVNDNIICICLHETDLVKIQNLKLVLELEGSKEISIENLKCFKREIREFVNTRLPT